MKTLSSSEFRRTFNHLTEPVTVTVLGRPIATYTPISSSIDDRAVGGFRPGEPPIPPAPNATGRMFDPAEFKFSPAPKPERKKR